MTALEVVSAGPGVSVQDHGRIGYRRFGVATSGAMDRRALALANALVGNPPGAAALEIAYGGAVVRAIDGPLRLAVVGPGTTVSLDGRARAGLQSFVGAPGARFAIGPSRGGVFSYLAVAGGILTPPDLGSRSFHLRSGIGGPALVAGRQLPCADADTESALMLPEGDWRPETGPIRYVAGPQEDRFTDAAHELFGTARFTVGHRSDRMAIRLSGPPLAHARGHDIVSDGVMPGSIQVPGDGQPIVLMRDCQTTGGYPKIGTVISADLDRLAQNPPGAEIGFAAVSWTEAIATARADAADIARLCACIRPAPRLDDSEFLLSQNLIGGVVSGTDS